MSLLLLIRDYAGSIGSVVRTRLPSRLVVASQRTTSIVVASRRTTIQVD